MDNYFNCRIRYEKLADDGRPKKVSEQYLVHAVSFTDAEARITEEMQKYISGGFFIKGITNPRFSELIFGEGDRWYRAKINFISYDEEKGTEKKSATYILVMADNVKEAYEIIEDKFTITISDYEIVSIADSNIMDVFTLPANTNEGNDNNE